MAQTSDQGLAQFSHSDLLTPGQTPEMGQEPHFARVVFQLFPQPHVPICTEVRVLFLLTIKALKLGFGT